MYIKTVSVETYQRAENTYSKIPNNSYRKKLNCNNTCSNM